MVTNSSLPGTWLSSGNLQTLRETEVRRRPGKTRIREITILERSGGDGSASLQLPSSSCRSRPRAAWCSTRSHHQPPVAPTTGALGPGPKAGITERQNQTVQETKWRSERVHASRAPHGKELAGD
uniref:Uncharacterized protein n=1 Tax=Rousettus aegyptiacus TaxID=9407 RepID=A0A7J8JGG0_ROUAE|nr:hypothetical protein HJG63_010247 [Rousettus aegyptiacus]